MKGGSQISSFNACAHATNFLPCWAKMYRLADGVAQAIRLVTVKPCFVGANATLPQVMMLV
jgi:hypothetical protein